MTTPARDPGQHPPGEQPERTPEDVMWGRVERRREKIRAQVHQARHGSHKVPTWLMATILGLILLGWLYLIFFE
jgi:hypothetical protein